MLAKKAMHKTFNIIPGNAICIDAVFLSDESNFLTE
jgi:hypothetical protein